MKLSFVPTMLRERMIDRLHDIRDIDSAALYGSAARGDMEAHSDIDLLLVCPFGRKQSVLAAVEPLLQPEFRKLSVALYSRDELQFLYREHSLFLLHLKREADVLFDRRGELGPLLERFQPKQSYRSDFINSLSLLDLLRTRVRNSPNDLHRMSYTYSLFRVFGVYLLAEKGIFEFSKSRMAECLAKEYPRARTRVEALTKLRPLNSNFFAGGSKVSGLDDTETLDLLDYYISALSELAGVAPYIIAERPFMEAVAEFESAANESKKLNYRLRTWFLLLAYDGLNLYSRTVGCPPLTSLSTESIEALASRDLPPSVAATALLTLECIRDYRLKYFLGNDTNGRPERAVTALHELAHSIR